MNVFVNTTNYFIVFVTSTKSGNDASQITNNFLQCVCVCVCVCLCDCECVCVCVIVCAYVCLCDMCVCVCTANAITVTEDLLSDFISLVQMDQSKVGADVPDYDPFKSEDSSSDDPQEDDPQEDDDSDSDDPVTLAEFERTLSAEKLALFLQRFENGYDLTNDSSYNCWRSLKQSDTTLACGTDLSSTPQLAENEKKISPVAIKGDNAQVAIDFRILHPTCSCYPVAGPYAGF